MEKMLKQDEIDVPFQAARLPHKLRPHRPITDAWSLTGFHHIVRALRFM
ncbi:MAG: hypothetical protein WCA10_24250 [Terracidiphilus sp.]